MAVKLKIRKGDKVVVLAGKDKGKNGEVLRVIPKDRRAIVQGVNVARRHQKQTAGQEGGIISKEDADPHFQPGAARSQGRQADAGRVQDSCRTASRSGSPSAPGRRSMADKYMPRLQAAL